jgi:subfamily B ATP-binding cassette protein MsbA
MVNNAEILSRKETLSALWDVLRFRPILTVAIIIASGLTALLEGIGISFIIPIIDLAQAETTESGSQSFVAVFQTIYDVFSIPFTLEFVVVGVAIVMFFRYASSVVVDWSRALLVTKYEQFLKRTLFGSALDASISYFDTEGTDRILNAIVTESRQSSQVLRQIVDVFEQLLLSLVYLSVAVYLAPVLTIGAAVLLGGLSFVVRGVFGSGQLLGDRMAAANESIQRAAQSATQGIRDVRLFNLMDELHGEFVESVNEYVTARVTLRRNQVLINNSYKFITATSVFVLIYIVFRFTDLTLGGLGVFLFAVFRLAPRISTLNDKIYRIEGSLPHLLRTRSLINELTTNEVMDSDGPSPPEAVQRVVFDDVTFGYNDRTVVEQVSFTVENDEFVGFVGESGAGKSTIVSLLTAMYRPDSGDIKANGRSIFELNWRAWRSKLGVVQQDPFIFNETLRYNLTIGRRSATETEIDRVCEIARVTEFFDELPNGYDTIMGEDGVRLSGGQKQRVALARALLKKPDILVLDEATSDLDVHIEQEVQNAIEKLDRDFAIVTIAHRLSTVENADRIYVIDDGQIVESGSHSDLLSQAGAYASLYQSQ